MTPAFCAADTWCFHDRARHRGDIESPWPSLPSISLLDPSPWAVSLSLALGFRSCHRDVLLDLGYELEEEAFRVLDLVNVFFQPLPPRLMR